MCGNISALYSIIFIRWGKVCFSLFNIPIILEHLLDTFSECFFQFTCVSRVSPKKFFYFFYDCINNFGSKCNDSFVVHMEQHNFVLAILSDSLFIYCHSLILKSSSFIKQFGSMFGVLVKLLTVLNSIVSSAYDINVKT